MKFLLIERVICTHTRAVCDLTGTAKNCLSHDIKWKELNTLDQTVEQIGPNSSGKGVEGKIMSQKLLWDHMRELTELI